MSETSGIRVLLAGFGAFGPVHLQAWLRLVDPGGIWIADPDPGARERAGRLGIPPARVVGDLGAALERVDLRRARSRTNGGQGGG